MMAMVENMLGVHHSLMAQAQAKDKACTRLQSVVANVSVIVPSFSHKSNRLDR